MTLPVTPDAETVLASCVATLRDVVLPEVESDWGRYSAELCVASIEYALGLLGEDRNETRRRGLAQAIEGVAADVRASGGTAWIAALEGSSPFVIAGKLLVAGQNDPGPLAERVRASLHPVLHAQLDAELTAGLPLFAAFAKNMSR
ncbi:MAG: hypothetical protein JRH10_10770 [Deltaproteobacteria bacterium]|nr:hypothetical protein [Deltaproteobacteria bacterium]MBW2445960.1 hypothetical protein [Deltaproteobacteria bacterium]